MPPQPTGITLTALRPRPGAPVLVLGPSLGTAVGTLWADCLNLLAGHFDLLGWDLPGHGAAPPTKGPFDLEDLAVGVAAAVARSRSGLPWAHAGVSLGGAVGLHLARRDVRLQALSVFCSGARIGSPEQWHERAATVREQGTGALVPGAAGRWFAPGAVARPRPRQLLSELSAVDDASYADACTALARHDLRDALPGITIPVLAAAGACDTVTPPETLRHIAEGVAHGRAAVLAGVAHLAPAEDPVGTSELLIRHHTGRRSGGDGATPFRSLIP